MNSGSPSSASPPVQPMMPSSTFKMHCNQLVQQLHARQNENVIKNQMLLNLMMRQQQQNPTNSVLHPNNSHQRPSPSSPPQGVQMSSTSLSYSNQQTFGDGKFLLLDKLEASISLYSCVNRETLQEFVCKVIPTQVYHNYLSGYIRMNGNPGVNVIQSVFVGAKQTFITFNPSYGDLHSYVRCNKRLKESEALRLFQQIVTIVNDCHENGICLRDLKLRKFVFTDPEKTKLTLETLDDAVVLKDTNDDLMNEKHGCPAYVSPEILSVNGKYSGRAADFWSLGVILYAMIVGRYPFHDTNPKNLFGKIKRGLYHVPNGLSPLTRCVIRSLLRQNPSERMTTSEILDSQLFSDSNLKQLEAEQENEEMNCP